MNTAVAVALCFADDCGNRIVAREMCRKHYERWRVEQFGFEQSARPDPNDKIAFLSTLSFGELHAYCAGVLSRASIAGGDPDEIATWVELIRLTASRTSE